jgi:hypothetical protein
LAHSIIYQVFSLKFDLQRNEKGPPESPESFKIIDGMSGTVLPPDDILAAYNILTPEISLRLQ